MDFYQTLGNLVLGSRLRRLSEFFLADINKIYQEKGIPFEASWFPVFYCLSKEPAISIRELSVRVQVSHSAMSQLVSSLKKKGWIQTEESTVDARKQSIQLTCEGQLLLQQVMPVWTEITEQMTKINTEHPETLKLLTGLAAFEEAFDKKPLSERVLNQRCYVDTI